MELVEAAYGDDTVYWFDEHFQGVLSIPETVERAEWYDITGWPYVRVDGLYSFMGIYTSQQTAELLSTLIDQRLAETGGMSPVAITGNFRADGTMLEWRVTFRLLDPASLVDLRGTFVAIEDDVLSYGELFPRVTRVIRYEPVMLVSPGDSAQFLVTVPQDAAWNEEEMRAIVFLQQTSDARPIIQGAVLPNQALAGVTPLTPDFVARPQIAGVAPNPFTTSTEVTLQLLETSARGPILLEVLDPLGRRVRELPIAATPRSASRVVVAWDGASDSGAEVPAGSYFIRLTTPDGVSRGKVIRVR